MLYHNSLHAQNFLLIRISSLNVVHPCLICHCTKYQNLKERKICILCKSSQKSCDSESQSKRMQAEQRNLGQTLRSLRLLSLLRDNSFNTNDNKQIFKNGFTEKTICHMNLQPTKFESTRLRVVVNQITIRSLCIILNKP